MAIELPGMVPKWLLSLRQMDENPYLKQPPMPSDAPDDGAFGPMVNQPRDPVRRWGEGSAHIPGFLMQAADYLTEPMRRAYSRYVGGEYDGGQAPPEMSALADAFDFQYPETGSWLMDPMAAFVGRPWLRGRLEDMLSAITGSTAIGRTYREYLEHPTTTAFDALKEWGNLSGLPIGSHALEHEVRGARPSRQIYGQHEYGPPYAEEALPSGHTLKEEHMRTRLNEPVHKFPYEIVPNTPYEGLPGIKKWTEEIAPALYGEPLSMGGGYHGGGGHVNVSYPNMATDNPNIIPRWLLSYLEQEPFVYPPRPAYKIPVREYGDPTLKDILEYPEGYEPRMVERPTIQEQARFAPRGKNQGINFNSIAYPDPDPDKWRAELRGFYQPATAEEATENMLLGQAIMDRARARPYSDVPKTFPEFQDYYHEAIVKPFREELYDIQKNWFPEGVHPQGSPFHPEYMGNLLEDVHYQPQASSWSTQASPLQDTPVSSPSAYTPPPAFIRDIDEPGQRAPVEFVRIANTLASGSPSEALAMLEGLPERIGRTLSPEERAQLFDWINYLRLPGEQINPSAIELPPHQVAAGGINQRGPLRPDRVAEIEQFLQGLAQTGSDVERARDLASPEDFADFVLRESANRGRGMPPCSRQDLVDYAANLQVEPTRINPLDEVLAIPDIVYEAFADTPDSVNMIRGMTRDLSSGDPERISQWTESIPSLLGRGLTGAEREQLDNWARFLRSEAEAAQVEVPRPSSQGNPYTSNPEPLGVSTSLAVELPPPRTPGMVSILEALRSQLRMFTPEEVIGTAVANLGQSRGGGDATRDVLAAAGIREPTRHEFLVVRDYLLDIRDSMTRNTSQASPSASMRWPSDLPSLDDASAAIRALAQETERHQSTLPQERQARFEDVVRHAINRIRSGASDAETMMEDALFYNAGRNPEVVDQYSRNAILDWLRSAAQENPYMAGAQAASQRVPSTIRIPSNNPAVSGLARRIQRRGRRLNDVVSEAMDLYAQSGKYDDAFGHILTSADMTIGDFSEPNLRRIEDWLQDLLSERSPYDEPMEF